MLPTIEGVMERRLLLNFRVDPERCAAELPNGLRPQIVADSAIVGVCMIRLRRLRPAGLPAFLGVASENAAHRIAVEWGEGDGAGHGVYIPRRDTDSRLNTVLGGRLFPGLHHRAAFEASADPERIRVRMRSLDGAVQVAVDGQVADRVPETSVFVDVDEVSAFFAKDTLGLSPAADGSLEGLELQPFTWAVAPLHLDAVESSYIRQRFGGSAVFDNALLMRGIRHRWHERPAPTSPLVRSLQD